MKKLILNAFGPDKTGIVYKLSKIIYSNKGNIHDSKMLRLESDFTIIMLISLDEKKIKSLENDLNSLKELNINVKITSQSNYQKNVGEYIFNVEVSDNEGIIYLFTKIFNTYNINIEKMETEINNAPISGSPLFTLNATLKISKTTNIKDLKKELDIVSTENDIDYSFQLK